METHEVEIDQSALDAEIERLSETEPEPEPEKQGQTGSELPPGAMVEVYDPVADWLPMATWVMGILASKAPAWKIPAEQTEANAKALARVLAQWGSKGPGDPDSWHPLLHLTYAMGTTVMAYGIDLETMTLKPLSYDMIDGETTETTHNQPQGEPGGETPKKKGMFTTVTDEDD